MIIRTIDKQILLTLVSNYNWDPIPREVIDHWVKMHGKNITIESEETEEDEADEDEADEDEEDSDDDEQIDDEDEDDDENFEEDDIDGDDE